MANNTENLCLAILNASTTTTRRCVPKRIDAVEPFLDSYPSYVQDLTVETSPDSQRILSHFTDAVGLADYTYLYPPVLLDATEEEKAEWPPDPLPDCLNYENVDTKIGASRALVVIAEGRDFKTIVLGFLDGHVEVVDGACRERIALQRYYLEKRAYESIFEIIVASQETSDPVQPESLKQLLSDPKVITDSLDLSDAEPDGKFNASDLYAISTFDAFAPLQTQQANFQTNSSVTNLQILAQFARDAIAITGIPEDDPTGIDLNTLLQAIRGELPPGEELPYELSLPADLISFDGLGDLTEFYASQPGITQSLRVKLDVAADADAAGELELRNKLLHAYRAEVDAQSGKAFTEKNARTLIVMSYTLETP